MTLSPPTKRGHKRLQERPHSCPSNCRDSVGPSKLTTHSTSTPKPWPLQEEGQELPQSRRGNSHGDGSRAKEERLGDLLLHGSCQLREKKKKKRESGQIWSLNRGNRCLSVVGACHHLYTPKIHTRLNRVQPKAAISPPQTGGLLKRAYNSSIYI